MNKYFQKSTLDDKFSWRMLNYNENDAQSHKILPLKCKNQTYYNTKDQAKILHDVLTNPPLPNTKKIT